MHPDYLLTQKQTRRAAANKTEGSMSSDGGGGSSSGGDGGSSATSIDARGHKEVDIQSTQQLWGALVPTVVLGLAYLAAFLYFRRRAAVRDVYDPKRRRLAALAQGRGHPTIRGLPEAWKERSPSLTPTPLPPPDVPASPWGWFLDLWRISDAAIITYTGADAYMFLRFLRVGCVWDLEFDCVDYLILSALGAFASAC